MRHSVLNAEAFTGVLFLLLFLLFRTRSEPPGRLEIEVREQFLYLGLSAIVVAACAPAFGMPLLHDSYGHVFTASREGFADVLRSFVAHPQSGDFFFRPLGILTFWLDARWAHFCPWRWHAWSVALHLANTLLVFALARRVGLGKLGAFGAALLFGLHGSRPEAVAWVAARFDLMAAFFVLLVLLSAMQYGVSGKRKWLAGVTLFCVAALLSKESAYCLPLLTPLVMALRQPSFSRQRFAAVFATVALTTLLVFGYRSYVLHGIGGYGAERGAPAILQFSLLRTVNALFFRQWALLFFPVDWESGRGVILWLALAAAVCGLMIVLATGRGSRRNLLITLGITVAAALPVQHMLLIGSDLSGARVLYLPMLGMALFWGLIFDWLPSRSIQVSVMLVLLFFQMVALEHNLRLWVQAARLAQRGCAYLADDLPQDGSPTAVLDVPVTWRGVYFMKNSLEACIVLNSGGRLKNPPHISANTSDAQHVYRWVESRFVKER